MKDSGFAEWADNNRLILLFPQVTETAGTVQSATAAGTGGATRASDYLTRKRPQIVAVKRMLDRLAEAPGSN